MNQPQEFSESLTVNDVANYLSISRASVYDMLGDGEIQSVHIRSSRRIPRREFERYLRRVGWDFGEEEAKENG
jgi:excisionase family DNA binding protein